MNFETLKIGFKLYLEGLEDISNKEYITDNSEISIFSGKIIGYLI